MWSKAQGEENTGARRKELLEKGYELFSTKSIESIGMRDVAKAVGCGSTSAYRYYGSKPDFVVAVATWKWVQFQEENKKRRPNADTEKMTAAEIFKFYLDSFIELYRNHRDEMVKNSLPEWMSREAEAVEETGACRDCDEFFNRTRYKVPEVVLTDDGRMEVFNNDLVIRYLDRVVVKDDGYEVAFKAGVTVEVEV